MNDAPTKLTIKVNSVIGTGDPFDVLMLIPLIHQWRVPQNCAIGALQGEDCKNPISRIYVLREPVEGHKCIGACESHHLTFAGTEDGSAG